MKSFFTLMVAVIMAFGVMMPAEVSDVPRETSWYEISRDGMGADVLTVRLDSNPSTGFDWSYEISDPEMLELLTQEFVSDLEGKGMIACGVGGTWAASFRSFSARAGEVTLTLNYARPFEDRIMYSRTIDMEIDEIGRIDILSVYES